MRYVYMPTKFQFSSGSEPVRVIPIANKWYRVKIDANDNDKSFDGYFVTGARNNTENTIPIAHVYQFDSLVDLSNNVTGYFDGSGNPHDITYFHSSDQYKLVLYTTANGLKCDKKSLNSSVSGEENLSVDGFYIDNFSTNSIASIQQSLIENSVNNDPNYNSLFLSPGVAVNVGERTVDFTHSVRTTFDVDRILLKADLGQAMTLREILDTIMDRLNENNMILFQQIGELSTAVDQQIGELSTAVNSRLDGVDSNIESLQEFRSGLTGDQT